MEAFKNISAKVAQATLSNGRNVNGAGNLVFKMTFLNLVKLNVFYGDVFCCMVLENLKKKGFQ